MAPPCGPAEVSSATLRQGGACAEDRRTAEPPRRARIRAWTLGRDPVGVVGRMPPSPIAGRDTEEGDETAEVVHGHDGPAAVQAGRTPLRALAIPSAI